MKTPATNFEALLGQARDCGLTLEFATAYEINVALDEVDCYGGGGGGLPEQSKSTTYTNNGSYTVNPDEGYTLSAVNITVDVDQNLTVISELQLEVAQLEGEIATITSLNISENGTFTPPAGILGYNSIDVNVAGGGGEVILLPEGTKFVSSTFSVAPDSNLMYNIYNSSSVEKLFYLCSSLELISFPENTFSNTTNFSLMMYHCDKLTKCDIPEGFAPKANNLHSMFGYNGKLTSIKFPNSMTNVVSFDRAFEYCASLSNIELGNILKSVKGCDSAFIAVSKMTSFNMSNGDFTSVWNLADTFEKCIGLTSLIFPEGSLQNVQYVNGLVSGCKALSEIVFPEGSLSKVMSAQWMFFNCFLLKEVTFPEGSLTNILRMSSMFSSCSAITTIIFPNSLSYYSSFSAYDIFNMFFNCTSLETLVIPRLPNVNLLSTGFSSCTSLTLSSLQNILNALPTTTSGYKCALGTTNLAKLSDTDIQIATDKGWTLN